MAGMAGERFQDGREVEQPQDLGSLHGAGQAWRSERGGNVEQRARDGGDRDAAVDGDVLGGEGG
jgi:hypothetical protein